MSKTGAVTLTLGRTWRNQRWTSPLAPRRQATVGIQEDGLARPRLACQDREALEKSTPALSSRTIVADMDRLGRGMTARPSATQNSQPRSRNPGTPGFRAAQGHPDCRAGGLASTAVSGSSCPQHGSGRLCSDWQAHWRDRSRPEAQPAPLRRAACWRNPRPRCGKRRMARVYFAPLEIKRPTLHLLAGEWSAAKRIFCARHRHIRIRASAARLPGIASIVRRDSADPGSRHESERIAEADDVLAHSRALLSGGRVKLR